MKRWMLVLGWAALLGGCKLLQPEPQAAPVKAPAMAQAVERAGLVDAAGAPIERVPFRAGISSVTVENMAKQQGCTGGHGAGLVTEPGPIEVYRMMCDNGKVFRARCELRQCKPM